MLPLQRQQLILEWVRRHGSARVADLGDEFDVSDMTIRRDLATLAEQGLLRKTHGGAIIAEPPSTDEPGFRAKSSRLQSEKMAIAAAVAQRVSPGDAVALSAGTTTHAVAFSLVDIPRLTVVTNSIPAAEAFHIAGRPDQTVVLTGGVRTPSDALVGPTAVTTLRGLHVNLTILGVHGMSIETGLTTPNLQEAETNRAMIACGRQLIVVADHTKWDVVGISSMATMGEVDVLVTDAGTSQERRDAVGQLVGELVIAEPLPDADEETA